MSKPINCFTNKKDNVELISRIKQINVLKLNQLCVVNFFLLQKSP